MERESGFAAKYREARKRSDIVRSGRFEGRLVVDVLSNMDIDFLPMGFELAGAPGNGWATFLKKASKIAHERRGHNRAAFTRKWKARMAMTIAKRGAEAALEKVAKIAGVRKFHKHPDIGSAVGAGPLGGSELPLTWEGRDGVSSLGRAFGAGGGG